MTQPINESRNEITLANWIAEVVAASPGRVAAQKQNVAGPEVVRSIRPRDADLLRRRVAARSKRDGEIFSWISEL